MAATSNSIVLNQDLRATAQDYRRDANDKHKWVLGETFGPGQATTHPKPKKPAQKHKIHKLHAAKAIHRQGIVSDRREVTTDSSCDEDIDSPETAPAPDAEVTYSYDAQRGPSQGSQILSSALAKAVAKFESNATEKLLRDEYEILDSDGEPLPTKAGKKAHKPNLTAGEEEDYEFV